MIKLNCLNCNSPVLKYESQIKNSSHIFCDHKCHYEWRHKNNIGYNKGLKLTKNQKDRISKTIKNKIKEGTYDTSNLNKYKKGNKPWNKDLTKSNDSRIISGEKHHNWVGGYNPYYNYDLSWNPIRIKILKRDNFTCQECNIKNKRLAVHHIVPFRISKNHNEDNLISVCYSCHAKLDNLQRNINGKS